MTLTLRPYQRSACDAALTEMRKSLAPCMIDAAPAAGKSFMIAYVANQLHKISGKRVLCIAPSSELVKQNHEKYLMTGEYASIFSASAGEKSTRHVVVFATPMTAFNSISRFRREGKNGFCAVIIDECHGISLTIKSIIEAMREANPNLRVLGLSGTPFRLGSGYIFREWPDSAPYAARINGDDVTRDPYFSKMVYRVSAREMLDQKFITPMVIGAIHARSYDTSGIEMLPNGALNPESVERAFVGHGRKTAAIVADIIDQARDRPGGIMYFAATVRHGREIMASLPPETSAFVTGDPGEKGERKKIIQRYRDRKIRHLVSVGTLTTGFDVAHTETIALLRYTESAALLQQIMGRAWRIFPGKETSLLLDYAENVERHFPDGDIYNPEIQAGKSAVDGVGIDAECPECGYGNKFSLNILHAEYSRDRHGYCVDVFGNQIMTDYGPLPAHFGRRCMGQVKLGSRGEYERCNYRWTGKDCPICGEKNDIAARYCYVCKAEIVDPNAKLTSDFKTLKRDPSRLQTDEVTSVSIKDGISTRGNRTVRADWKTPYRQFSTWHRPEAADTRGANDWARFFEATKDKAVPKTVSYLKEESGFFRIVAYNREADTAP